MTVAAEERATKLTGTRLFSRRFACFQEKTVSSSDGFHRNPTFLSDGSRVSKRKQVVVGLFPRHTVRPTDRCRALVPRVVDGASFRSIFILKLIILTPIIRDSTVSRNDTSGVSHVPTSMGGRVSSVADVPHVRAFFRTRRDAASHRPASSRRSLFLFPPRRRRAPLVVHRPGFAIGRRPPSRRHAVGLARRPTRPRLDSRRERHGRRKLHISRFVRIVWITKRTAVMRFPRIVEPLEPTTACVKPGIRRHRRRARTSRRRRLRGQRRNQFILQSRQRR